MKSKPINLINLMIANKIVKKKIFQKINEIETYQFNLFRMIANQIV